MIFNQGPATHMMDTGGAAINIFILKGLMSYTRESPVTWCVALH